MDGNYFLGHERGSDGGIHAIRDHNNAQKCIAKVKKSKVLVLS
jgi:hypothetical protein